MKTLLKPGYPAIRWLLIGLTGFLAVLVILPPFVSPELRVLVYHALSPVCHQIPERSFSLHGIPFGVCVRCTGIAAGFLPGLVLPWKGIPTWKARQILLIATAPAFIDWLLGLLGIWDSWITGSLTGAWMGIVFAGAVIALNRQVKVDN